MLAIVGLLSLGLLTACGGGGAAQTVKVTMGENGTVTFNPKDLKVSAGDIKVELVNSDPSQPHSFTIPALNVKSKQVAAGKTDSVTIKGAKAGQEYEIICDTPGHKEGGMVGKLIVQ
jgi:uncharacterized cupredoxin-like copper-binding protein